MSQGKFQKFFSEQHDDQMINQKEMSNKNETQ